tara:strand:- start:30543 stop:30758 length:216 start_codon:yes stop_codon:yes gene_type:complete
MITQINIDANTSDMFFNEGAKSYIDVDFSKDKRTDNELHNDLLIDAKDFLNENGIQKYTPIQLVEDFFNRL